MDKLPATFGLLCGGFFFLITLAGGIVLILLNQKSKKKAGESQHWPNTQGTITVSEVRQSTSTDDEGDVSIAYYPHIEYSYTVSGQTYSSKRVAFGGTMGYKDPNQAQAKLANYALNSLVPVFYNPQNPAEAVLEQNVGSGGKLTLIFGIVLLVISVIIACPLLIGIIRNFF